MQLSPDSGGDTDTATDVKLETVVVGTKRKVSQDSLFQH
jgi:hypothetical protein